jgi:hypothetical protein
MIQAPGANAISFLTTSLMRVENKLEPLFSVRFSGESNICEYGCPLTWGQCYKTFLSVSYEFL